MHLVLSIYTFLTPEHVSSLMYFYFPNTLRKYLHCWNIFHFNKTFCYVNFNEIDFFRLCVLTLLHFQTIVLAVWLSIFKVADIYLKQKLCTNIKILVHNFCSNIWCREDQLCNTIATFKGKMVQKIRSSSHP